MNANWLWLDDLTHEEIMTKPIPFPQLLAGSVYYPACGIDREPIKHLRKLSRSFVYVDYN